MERIQHHPPRYRTRRNEGKRRQADTRAAPLPRADRAHESVCGLRTGDQSAGSCTGNGCFAWPAHSNGG